MSGTEITGGEPVRPAALTHVEPLDLDLISEPTLEGAALHSLPTSRPRADRSTGLEWGTAGLAAVAAVGVATAGPWGLALGPLLGLILARGGGPGLVGAAGWSVGLWLGTPVGAADPPTDAAVGCALGWVALLVAGRTDGDRTWPPVARVVSAAGAAQAGWLLGARAWLELVGWTDLRGYTAGALWGMAIGVVGAGLAVIGCGPRQPLACRWAGVVGGVAAALACPGGPELLASAFRHPALVPVLVVPVVLAAVGLATPDPASSPA